MECPLCKGLVVFNGVEYVCSQCGVVHGVEHVMPPIKPVKVAREKPSGEREWRRYLALRKAAITTAIKAPLRVERQWIPPSKRVERWIWALCFKLDIPPIQCVKAVEAFRQTPRIL